MNWPIPKTAGEIRIFLGLTGWYRKYIKNFSDATAPLTELTKKTVEWTWGQKEAEAFQTIKDALTQPPVLLVPDHSLPFQVHTDAAGIGSGRVLSQDQGNGQQPIAYGSQKFSPAERNYSTHEQEMLAIIHALLKEWRHFLEGSPHKVHIYTDHASLRYFLSQPTLSRRQTRWNELLADFDLEFHYRPGEENEVPDALSRRSDYTHQEGAQQEGAQDTIAVITMSKQVLIQDPNLLESCRTGYKEDPFYTEGQAESKANLEQRDGMWYFEKTRLAIPDNQALRQKILSEHHDPKHAGHLGGAKLEAAAKRICWWPRLTTGVEEFVKTCDECQRNKISNMARAGLLQPLSIPKSNFEEISMDFVGKLPKTTTGFDHIFVVVCRKSKMVRFIPTFSNIKAPQLAKLFVKEIYCRYGMPRAIVSDRDTKFTSNYLGAVMKLLGTTLKMSSAYHPETDGQTERANRTMEEMLRAFVHPRQDDWDEYLPLVEFAYNNSVNATTKFTPFFMNYGRHPSTPIDSALQPDRANMPAVEDWLQQLQATQLEAEN